MRTLFFLVIFMVFACKNDPKQTEPETETNKNLVETVKDSLPTNREDVELKKQQSISSMLVII